MRQASLQSETIASNGIPTLEQFFDRIRNDNPFLANRMDRPLTADLIDVFGIHDAEFRRLLNLGRQAFREQRGIGALVWGEAGAGKTHLLARLGRWTGQREQALFVYLHNLQAHPQRVPINLLQSILGALTGSRMLPLRQTMLFKLINKVVRKAMESSGLQRGSWLQISNAFHRLIRRLAAQDPSQGELFEPRVFDVLFRYFQSAHPMYKGQKDADSDIALRWLMGDLLTDAERAQLQIHADDRFSDAVAVSSSQHAKHVLNALAWLAHCTGQFLLLGFDQIDNLEEAQVAALARFLHDVLDSVGNLLVVTTGIRETLIGFRKNGTITETSWNRIGQVEITLQRISKNQGRELIQTRLAGFMANAHGLSEIEERIKNDPLFPLGTDWFERCVAGLTDFRPRDVLSWASQAWQEHQDTLTTTSGPVWLKRLDEMGAKETHDFSYTSPDDQTSEVSKTSEVSEVSSAPDQWLPGAIDNHINQCSQSPHLLPPSQERLKEIVIGALDQCRQSGCYSTLLEVQQVNDAHVQHAHYDLIVRHRLAGGRQVCIGVCCPVLSNANSTAALLQRLVQHPHPPDMTVLVTDQRQPLPLGAKGRERLMELHARGEDAFQLVELSLPQLAELDALHHIADLIHKHPITESEAIKTLLAMPRFKSHRLLRLLASAENFASLATAAPMS